MEIINLEDLENQLLKEVCMDIRMMESVEKNMIVTNVLGATQALSMALQSRKLEKAIEQSRVEITKPHVDYQRAVNKIAKEFKSKLEAMENSLKSKIDEWMEEQKDNPFSHIDEITVDDGILYTQKSWDFEIENPHLVPKNYTTIVDSLIAQDIKNGVRNIPGVRIFETEKTVMRIKN